MPLPRELTRSIRSTASVKTKTVRTSRSSIGFVNIGLLALCAGLLLYYVVLVNGWTAAKYRISSLQNQLSYYTDLHSSLIDQQSELQNSEDVAAFAAAHNMVAAHDISYVFENGNIALGR
ncbi:MAG TPA: hypothetical protein VG866_01890 [Candidatus Paceibacterota bacterium]|nr:hypothetical protein [Candidatus Paceibacterota bacterium]